MKINTRLFLLLSFFTVGIAFSALRENLDHHHAIYISAEEPYVPFIDLLEVGESYQIEIISLGCFNGSKQTLAVFREVDSYTVRFEDVVIELDEEAIDNIREFELELQSLSLGGCSTVDTYKLVYGANSFQVSDGTCSFNGGRKLMKQLDLSPSK